MNIKLINKKIEIINFFYYNKDKSNIINYILEYFQKTQSIKNTIINLNNNYNSKYIFNKLLNVKTNNYKIKYQYIDNIFKCIYFILENNSLIFIEKPSGAIFNVPIITNIKKYYLSIDNTLKIIQI